MSDNWYHMMELPAKLVRAEENAHEICGKQKSAEESMHKLVLI